MAIVNQDTLEIYVKVLILGDKGSGKSTLMGGLYSYLEGVSSAQLQGNAESVSNFDVLAVELGEVGRYSVKAHLFGVDLWNPALVEVDQAFLEGADAVVWMINSDPLWIDRQMQNWQERLEHCKFDEKGALSFLCYHKRDLAAAVPIKLLERAFNSDGGFETLETRMDHKDSLIRATERVFRAVIAKMAEA